MTKEEFLASIQKGKWFRVYNKYQTVYAVKMQQMMMSGREIIQSIWLSFNDPESLSF